MAKKFDVNKLSDHDKRHLENIRERLRSQGVGEDEATQRALNEIFSGTHSGTGGGKKAGGEAQKITKPKGRKRTGSRSNRSK